MLLSFIHSFVILLSAINQEVYTPSDKNSTIQFTIRNFGVNTEGTFTGLKGKVQFNPDQDGNFAELTVDTKTVNTGINLRDNHLRKEKYFDVTTYPLIKFTSTSLKKG
ncbi:MAG: YceI family protein, partial [Flammeovirgaceae bacterium]|nr:YceI family protein [Flammeovirgaceae bacterium]